MLYAALQNSLDGGTLYYIPDTVDGLGLIAADAGRLEEALRVLIASAAERKHTGKRVSRTWQRSSTTRSAIYAPP